MMLFRAPNGKTHLCWSDLKGGARAECRHWWPNRDWTPVPEGGEITCRSCMRRYIHFTVPPWDPVKSAPAWVPEGEELKWYEVGAERIEARTYHVQARSRREAEEVARELNLSDAPSCSPVRILYTYHYYPKLLEQQPAQEAIA